MPKHKLTKRGLPHDALRSWRLRISGFSISNPSKSSGIISARRLTRHTKARIYRQEHQQSLRIYAACRDASKLAARPPHRRNDPSCCLKPGHQSTRPRLHSFSNAQEKQRIKRCLLLECGQFYPLPSVNSLFPPFAPDLLTLAAYHCLYLLYS
jgi:hypothetical protein